MSKKFYIADWHYGHANIMAYDNRPFTWVDDMNKALVERWNRVVSPGDIVYMCWAICFGFRLPSRCLCSTACMGKSS